MNYNIAVCDDSAADRKYISDMVDEWAAGKGCDVRAMAFESAESFMFCYDDKKDYDILLLDIEMGGMDGVTMAKRVRAENTAVQIVFITGYTDYIAEGYDVAALHYLVKPVREEKLFEVLDRAAAKIRSASSAARSRSSAAARSSACRFMRSAISMWRKTTRPSTRSGIIR